MAAKLSASAKQRTNKTREEEARFEAWINDFDARMAELTARQDQILRKLGVEPAGKPIETERA